VDLLLDTPAFLWWLGDDPKLGPEARAHIAKRGNSVYISAAAAWEIAVKRASGKLEAPGAIEGWVEEEGFVELPIAVAHAVRSAELPRHHGDPFDRLMVAQAQLEDLALVARDDQIDKYDVAIVDAGR
jgi:PIN domain nuclease of toxin-antitoxin system